MKEFMASWPMEETMLLRNMKVTDRAAICRDWTEPTRTISSTSLAWAFLRSQWIGIDDFFLTKMPMTYTAATAMPRDVARPAPATPKSK